jgi:hypothetical protein
MAAKALDAYTLLRAVTASVRHKDAGGSSGGGRLARLTGMWSSLS